MQSFKVRVCKYASMQTGGGQLTHRPGMVLLSGFMSDVNSPKDWLINDKDYRKLLPILPHCVTKCGNCQRQYAHQITKQRI
jgi:hypothetical protein